MIMKKLLRSSCWAFSFILPVFFLSTKPSLASSPKILSELEKEIIVLVHQVEPFVVTVSAKFDYNLIDNESAFLGLKPDKKESIPIEMENVGSGVIIDANHIVTLGSIVIGSKDINVQTMKGETFPGTLIGLDDEYGLAVIKVENLSMSPVKEGDSDRLESGCLVLIIGNSLGVTPAVSLGVVNAIRSDGAIQLSTNVAAGSVGGPVFDVSGNLVGILGARISETTNNIIFRSPFIGNEGALAYPYNKIKEKVAAFINPDAQPGGWIGVSAENWPGNRGWVHISDVKENSPAHEYGLKMGDILFSIEGQNIESAYQLARSIRQHKPGESIRFGILRGNEKREINVVVGQAEEPSFASEASAAFSKRPANIGAIQVQGAQQGHSSQLDQEFLLMRIRTMEREIQTLRTMIKH